MSKQKLSWTTERRRVKDLAPADNNPNVNDDRQFGKLKESIKRDGYVEIIAADVDGKIVAGSHRWKALMEMGKADEEIDVRIPCRKLEKAEFDRYLIASNALKGDFDFDALFKNFDTDLLVDLIDEETLAKQWDVLLETDDDGFETEKEIKKIIKPRVNPGDIYKLGDHTLGCIDSTDIEMVKKLVGDERMDFVDVDPPFNIQYSYKGKNNKYGGQEKDDRSQAEYTSFIEALIANSIAVSKKDTHYIFWCDERWVFLLQTLYQKLGIISKRLCVWAKDNAMPTPDTAFNKVTEFACYGTIGTPYLNATVTNINTVMNKEIGTGQRLIDDILDLFNIWCVKRLPGSTYTHPTEKSPTLHEKALRRCTRVGDNVLDLTAGSGSLMVACEQLKRRAFLAEVDPIFATLILNRYEKLSGKKAEKLN